MDDVPLDVDARDGESRNSPGSSAQQHAEEPDSRAVCAISPSMNGGLRARYGSRGRTSSRAHDRPRIVGYVSRAPPGDPRRAIERTWPADRLASRLRIEWIAEHTEARWHEVAATSCWEAPSAGSDPSCARRRGGVAPRWAARRCSRRTTVRRRASCTRPRRAGHRSRDLECERHPNEGRLARGSTPHPDSRCTAPRGTDADSVKAQTPDVTASTLPGKSDGRPCGRKKDREGGSSARSPINWRAESSSSSGEADEADARLGGQA
jgi:hypothetical protein